MTPQSSFMIVVPIIGDRRVELESLMASMNHEPGQVDPVNPVLPFAHFAQLHTARLLIIDALTADEMRAYDRQPNDWSPSLAFLGEVDGTCEDFLAWIAVTAREGLDALFQHCEGYATHRGSLLRFLQQHQVSPAASYVNWRGRTVTQVHEESQLQKALSARLAIIVHDRPEDRQNVRKLRQELLTFVQLEQHRGRLILTPISPPSWRQRLRQGIDLLLLPLILLLLSPILLLIAPWALWRLRQLERTDPDILHRASPEHIARLARIEDIEVCNQFNVFGDLKPGLFRQLLLRGIMQVVDWSCRHVYTRGFLGRVRSIHFARWVFLGKGRSMYFASLYDGSLESYMDDFINKVAFGLNLTFSHGVGYPRTRWMIKGGAEREQEFKNTLRRHQLPSAVWYRAHPGLTALDMARNSRIREGVDSWPESDERIRAWLGELQ